MRGLLALLLETLGAAAVVYGVFQVSEWAGWIVLGLALILGAQAVEG